MGSSDDVKATLYTFDGSVWGSVPRVGLIEKGYKASDVEIRQVDLFSGANFAPSYLRLNSKGTVPTLVVPLANTTSSEVDTKYRAISDSKAILEFLDQSRSQQILEAKASASLSEASNPAQENSPLKDEAPAPILAPATIEGKSICDRLISLVHSSDVDPNFLLMGSRSLGELEANSKGLQGKFISNRHEALKKYQKENQELSSASVQDGTSNPRSISTFENLSKWYSEKLKELDPLIQSYSNPSANANANSEASQALISKTKSCWKNVFTTLGEIKQLLIGPFALGDQVSLADIHLMVWFARLLTVCQGLKENQPSGNSGPKMEFKALENSLGNDCLKEAFEVDSTPAPGTSASASASAVGNDRAKATSTESQLDQIETLLGDGKLERYWNGLKERESFKTVYKDGLH